MNWKKIEHPKSLMAVLGGIGLAWLVSRLLRPGKADRLEEVERSGRRVDRV